MKFFHSQIGSESLSPGYKVQDKNKQPNDECECTNGKSYKHQPTQYSESIKELTIIVAVDDAGVHRAFVHAAPKSVSD